MVLFILLFILVVDLKSSSIPICRQSSQAATLAMFCCRTSLIQGSRCVRSARLAATMRSEKRRGHSVLSWSEDQSLSSRYAIEQNVFQCALFTALLAVIVSQPTNNGSAGGQISIINLRQSGLFEQESIVSLMSYGWSSLPSIISLFNVWGSCQAGNAYEWFHYFPEVPTGSRVPFSGPIACVVLPSHGLLYRSKQM